MTPNLTEGLTPTRASFKQEGEALKLLVLPKKIVWDVVVVYYRVCFVISSGLRIPYTHLCWAGCYCGGKIGAIVTRIGFWDLLDYIYNTEPPW